MQDCLNRANANANGVRFDDSESPHFLQLDNLLHIQFQMSVLTAAQLQDLFIPRLNSAAQQLP